MWPWIGTCTRAISPTTSSASHPQQHPRRRHRQLLQHRLPRHCPRVHHHQLHRQRCRQSHRLILQPWHRPRRPQRRRRSIRPSRTQPPRRPPRRPFFPPSHRPPTRAWTLPARPAATPPWSSVHGHVAGTSMHRCAPREARPRRLSEKVSSRPCQEHAPTTRSALNPVLHPVPKTPTMEER